MLVLAALLLLALAALGEAHILAVDAPGAARAVASARASSPVCLVFDYDGLRSGEHTAVRAAIASTAAQPSLAFVRFVSLDVAGEPSLGRDVGANRLPGVRCFANDREGQPAADDEDEHKAWTHAEMVNVLSHGRDFSGTWHDDGRQFRAFVATLTRDVVTVEPLDDALKAVGERGAPGDVLAVFVASEKDLVGARSALLALVERRPWATAGHWRWGVSVAASPAARTRLQRVHGIDELPAIVHRAADGEHLVYTSATFAPELAVGPLVDAMVLLASARIAFESDADTIVDETLVIDTTHRDAARWMAVIVPLCRASAREPYRCRAVTGSAVPAGRVPVGILPVAAGEAGDQDEDAAGGWMHADSDVHGEAAVRALVDGYRAFLSERESIRADKVAAAEREARQAELEFQERVRRARPQRLSVYDWAPAIRRATRNLLIVYERDDCHQCGEIEPELRKVARAIQESAELRDSLGLVVINCSDVPEPCEERALTGYPAVYFQKQPRDTSAVDEPCPSAKTRAQLPFSGAIQAEVLLAFAHGLMARPLLRPSPVDDDDAADGDRWAPARLAARLTSEETPLPLSCLLSLSEEFFGFVDVTVDDGASQGAYVASLDFSRANEFHEKAFDAAAATRCSRTRTPAECSVAIANWVGEHRRPYLSQFASISQGAFADDRPVLLALQHADYASDASFAIAFAQVARELYGTVNCAWLEASKYERFANSLMRPVEKSRMLTNRGQSDGLVFLGIEPDGGVVDVEEAKRPARAKSDSYPHVVLLLGDGFTQAAHFPAVPAQADITSADDLIAFVRLVMRNPAAHARQTVMR